MGNSVAIINGIKPKIIFIPELTRVLKLLKKVLISTEASLLVFLRRKIVKTKINAITVVDSKNSGEVKNENPEGIHAKKVFVVGISKSLNLIKSPKRK